MIYVTDCQSPIHSDVTKNYIKALINMFFKILPLREDREPTLCSYIKSVQNELIGCSDFVMEFHYDPNFLSLISILQYLIDHPDSPVDDVKREVFRAIRICEKIGSEYDQYFNNSNNKGGGSL